MGYALDEGGQHQFVQALFAESSTPLHKLGTKRLVGDRTYRYAWASEAIAEGDLCSWIPETVAIAATKFDDTAIGATTLALDVTVAANLMNDGYLGITDAAGEKQTRKIHHNSAGTAGTTDANIYLYRGLTTALTAAASVGALYANPYRVQIANAANPMAECLMGLAPMAVTDEYYFWLQTRGPGMIIAGTTTIAAGNRVQGAEDDTGAGQISVAGEALTSFIGTAVEAGADGVCAMTMIDAD